MSDGEQEVDEEVEELFFEGSDLHGEGRHEEALNRFERALALHPTYKDAILGKAMVHMARSEFDQAIECAKRIIEIDPEDLLAYTNLSVFYQRAGKIPEAEEAAAKAKVLDWKRQIQGG